MVSLQTGRERLGAAQLRSAVGVGQWTALLAGGAHTLRLAEGSGMSSSDVYSGRPLAELGSDDLWSPSDAAAL